MSDFRMSYSSLLKYNCHVAGLFLLILAISMDCQAQSTADSSEYAGLQKFPDWQISLGIVSVYWPLYDGSDKDETVPFPLIDIQYKNRYFINSDDGVGYFFRNDDRISAGVGVNFALGRKETRSSSLSGLGNVDPGAPVDLIFRYMQDSRSVGLKLINIVSGDDAGTELEAVVDTTRVFANRYVVVPALTASFATSEHMQSYFGVKSAQSASSGIDEFKPEAGIKSVGAELSAVYLYSANWNIFASSTFDLLVGDAADSPVTLDENQIKVSFGVSYRF